MAILNDLLLRTIAGQSVERPPIWLMRQAGRILPQYREVRASVNGFKALVKDTELSAVVTVQPVDELGVDAAIFFSDILVIPECMGLDYELVEKKGPLFPKVIENRKDIDQLISGEEAASKLDYVFGGVANTLELLNERVPLIGFSGAPWTLFCYMLEGQGSKTFSKAKAFLYQHPEDAEVLLDKLTDTIIAYLQLKIKAGVAVVQLFDSWAGVLDQQLYRKFMLPRIQRIKDAITEVPMIIFCKGAWFALEEIGQVGSEVIGIDWNIAPNYARKILGNDRIVQGNLDPCVLYANPKEIENHTRQMIEKWGKSHIVNLGHGVYPDTPLDNVKHFVNTVKSYRY